MRSMIPSGLVYCNGEDLSRSYICLIEDKIFRCLERFAMQEKKHPNLRDFQRYILLIPSEHLKAVLDSLVFADYLVEHKNSRTVRYSQIKAKEYAVCDICGQVEQSTGRTSLAVDHNHATGKIRGLLCTKCNWALAVVESDFMERASEYLKKYQ
jgi:hypothetical protein